MSLDYDRTKCNPPKPKDANDSILFDTLVWATVFTGISDITEKSVMEFYARVHAIELLDQSSRQVVTPKGLEPLYTSVDDIRRWIGLHTNASLMNRTQFMKTISNRLDHFIQDARREGAK